MYRFMPLIDRFSRQVDGNNFALRPAQGSALLMCLVFLSALSTAALSGLKAAWSGQRTVSAYVNHQLAFLRLERELLLGEQAAWQRIRTSGLEHFLATPQGAKDSQTDAVLKIHGHWMGSEFSQQQCGALFEVLVLSEGGVSSALQLKVRWDVCCLSRELCMAADFKQQRRLWSRVTDSSAM